VRVSANEVVMGAGPDATVLVVPQMSGTTRASRRRRATMSAF
jgi:hypothetical protein